MPKKPPSEPAEWLRASCCPVGESLRVWWLRRSRRSGELETCRTQEEADGLCDWALREPPRLFGDEQIVRVRFCPGCGVPMPRLKKRAVSTYHPANFDGHTGHCLTCEVRYCSGQDPAHVFEVDAG